MDRFDEVWRSLEQTVVSCYAPGIVAGIRLGDRSEVFATGRLSFEPDAPPMVADTPFRIASLGKIVLGVLALQLHDEGVFALDDPLERWFPEFAEPRVLRAPDAPLDDTVAAHRGIRMRDLVTLTAGFAFPWPETPLTQAMAGAGVASGPRPAQLPPEDFASRLAALPLAHQPGERFTYDTAADVLSIALARATGTSLADLVRTRIAAPLALTSTAFHVAPATVLPTPYRAAEGGALEVADELVGVWERPPVMESLRAGLLSSVPDFLRILAAIADDELLTAEQRRRLTSDQLTDSQREGLEAMGDTNAGWGWQLGVDLLTPAGESPQGDAVREGALAREPWRASGRWGWAGGTGTSAYHDPTRALTGVVFTQHLLGAKTDDHAFFWGSLAALRRA